MSPLNRCRPCQLFLILTTSLVGCSGDDGGNIKPPPLAPVQGTITLDGNPLPDAQVEFVPAHARASIGKTDANGVYQLNYDAKLKGAAVGEHTVRVVTKLEAGMGEELVPLKYNTQSTLKADVAEGENTIDFDLQSK